MLIGTLNQALATIRTMSRNEINTLTAELEADGGLHCKDKRKKRDFCTRNVILMWDRARWDMVRYIYNALED